MKQDIWLFVVVFAVWAALAVLYAAVPMFHMPGYAGVWGWGAVIFLALAVLICLAGRKTHADNRDPGQNS
jgi:membrane protein implicated in regulation of membrane protease activity